MSEAEITFTRIGGAVGEMAGLRVLRDSELFTHYHTGDDGRPCLHPLVGPTGVPMTREFPLSTAREGEQEDHPHHRSVWFAHGDINGHDFRHGAATQLSSGARRARAGR